MTPAKSDFFPNSTKSFPTLLLVDDEPTILAFAQRALKDAGYNVFTAESPADAFRIADAHKDLISLVITDIIMPQLSGYDLIDKINKIIPSAKYLVMSGADPEDLALYENSDSANPPYLPYNLSYIQKPFDAYSLKIAVEAIFTNK
jgi:DNA-binding NtrC family response regulator